MAKDIVLPTRFNAAITEKQLGAVEQAAQEWGVTRRIALATLSKSSKQLLKGLQSGGETTAEAMLAAHNSIREYLTWRTRETAMLEAAQARTLLVLEQFSTQSGAR